MIDVPDYVENGCDANCDINWVEKEFIREIEDIFLDEDYEKSSDDEYGDDIPSDDEFDQDD